MPYPTKWRVTMASIGVDMTLTAAFDDQEFITIIAKPAFWEGRVKIEGTFNHAPIGGVGFVERNGFENLKTLEQFFKVCARAAPCCC